MDAAAAAATSRRYAAAATAAAATAAAATAVATAAATGQHQWFGQKTDRMSNKISSRNHSPGQSGGSNDLKFGIHDPIGYIR